MRLISRHFLGAAAAFALFASGTAQAQPQDGGYQPPPVDYADAAPAPMQPQPLRVAAPEEQGPPAAAAARPRRSRVDVGGFVEVQGGASGELSGGGGLLGDDEVLTYTSVSAGVDGHISTRRVTASFGYRYERRFELNGNLPDADQHDGIAQMRAELVPNTVSVEAGGIATRTGGTGFAVGVTDRDATTEVYAGYAGPTLTTRAGPVSVNAFYRLGYVHVDDDSLAGAASPEGDFDSTIHMAGASVGEAPGRLPIGWTVSAGHVSASTSGFETEFEGQFVRGDVLLPVNPSLALSAGIGWSRGASSQLDAARDANGVPIFDSAGNLRPDPNRPRVTSYDQDGIYADAGFIWRPTPRSELQLRAGINDDGEPVVLGSAAFQVGRNFGFSFTLYDEDETFGSRLVKDIKNLPDEFTMQRELLRGGVTSGCVFDEDQPGRGICLSPSLQSITSASFRARGGSVLFSGSGRLWSWGGGISYAHRGYYLPDDPIFANAYAPSDQDLALFGSVSRRLSRDSDIGLDGFMSFYDSEAQDRDSTTIGGRVSYSRSFLMSRLQLLVALGLVHRSVFGDNSLVADGIIGFRYVF